VRIVCDIWGVTLFHIPPTLTPLSSEWISAAKKMRLPVKRPGISLERADYQCFPVREGWDAPVPAHSEEKVSCWEARKEDGGHCSCTQQVQQQCYSHLQLPECSGSEIVPWEQRHSIKTECAAALPKETDFTVLRKWEVQAQEYSQKQCRYSW
jgi:hypothetical protein